MPGSRLFLVDFDVVNHSGHFFNQALGFRASAVSLGLEPHFFIPKQAAPNIIAALDARAILPPVSPYETDRDAASKTFVEVSAALRDLWSAIGDRNVARDDILLITSSRPAVIHALGGWLETLAPNSCPAIFLRAFGTNFLNAQNTDYSNRSEVLGHALKQLGARRGQERVHLTLNNRKQIGRLEALGLRRVFFMPPPKYYGDVEPASAPDKNSPATIYIHANRPGAGLVEVAAAAASVLAARNDVKFKARIYRHTIETGETHEAARTCLTDAGADVLTADDSHAEYLDTIARSHIVWLPYHPVEYCGIVSGPFCEAAALGKIVVAPAGTWMANQIADGRTTGVLFSQLAAADMAAAIVRTLENRTRLQEEAIRLAGAFRAENSCRRNIELMLGLARERHDMLVTV